MSIQDNEQEILENKIRHIEKYAIDQYQRAQNYTNIIIVAGYAAFFTILTNISADLSIHTRIISSLLIGFSCAVFIIWEVFKMIYLGFYTRKLIISFSSINTVIEQKQKLEEIQIFEKDYNSSTGRLWIFVLIATILPAILGLLVMFYGAIKAL